MGYYTRFKLDFKGDREKTDEVVLVLEFSKLQNESYKTLKSKLKDLEKAETLYEKVVEKVGSNIVSWLYNFWTDRSDEMKWYEHEEEMRKFSKLFPEVLFELEGKGEEQGDHWIKYFKKGKMQICKAEITFPPFDESQLA